MRRTALKTLALALAALTLPATGALAQTAYKPEYKLSTVVGPAFPWGKGGEIWADLVRERTKGRINIKMYPGASLVGGDQLIVEPIARSMMPWRIAENSLV